MRMKRGLDWCIFSYGEGEATVEARGKEKSSGKKKKRGRRSRGHMLIK